MTVVIAVLLALILVAMVSSNQSAASGVWAVIRFAIWGVASLFAWGLLIGYVVWFYSAYPPDGEWKLYLGLTCVVILPPLLLWFARQDIARAYRNNKWAAIKHGAVLVGYILAIMLIGVISAEIRSSFNYGGWLMILFTLAFTGVILLSRSIGGKYGWSEVWFGPPKLAEPWRVLQQQRDDSDAMEEALWEKVDESWHELTPEEQDEYREQRGARIAEREERLSALSEKLEAEYAARAKDEKWTVRGFFWLALIFAGFGLLGVLWDLCFAYAMNLKFVKGQAWLAGATVVGFFLAIAGLLISAWETYSESQAKRTSQIDV